jgi:hypothetical protein
VQAAEAKRKTLNVMGFLRWCIGKTRSIIS